MKKQVLVIAFLGLITISFAQKKEVKALEKAFKSEKFTETEIVPLISAAEKVITNADDKTKAKFYYLKTAALLIKGTDYKAIEKALEQFKANGNQKDKQKITIFKNGLADKLVGEVIKNGEIPNAVSKLYTAYKLSGNESYLYNAALKAVINKEYKKALPLYIKLKEIGYTGVKTEYKAYNKETKKQEVFSSEIMRNASVRSGTHIKPIETKTESLKSNIIKNIAYMYVDLGKTDKAIEAVKEARTIDKNDINLLMTEANLYLKLKKKNKFKELMKEATLQDPTNPSLFFNIGIVEAEQGNIKEAKANYAKSLALDPKNADVNLNMVSLILKGEASIIEKMNSLTTSSVDNKKYKVLEKQRIALYNEALPFLTTVLKTDAKNKSVINSLKGLYSALGNTVKYKEMKALLENL